MKDELIQSRIVFIGNHSPWLLAFDPVSAGLVASLNHPGGNITGVSVILSALAAIDLKDRLRDVETDGCDRFHAWLAQNRDRPSGDHFNATYGQWGSRPQHHEQTSSLFAE